MFLNKKIKNYWLYFFTGWQPRWFVLDYGVLAYYRSQDEMSLGSRGSVKLSCCEILSKVLSSLANMNNKNHYVRNSFYSSFLFIISVNNADPIRIDLKIPPENYMYLKASTAAERQKWLVALGTAKACLVDSNAEEQQQKSMYIFHFFVSVFSSLITFGSFHVKSAQK